MTNWKQRLQARLSLTNLCNDEKGFTKPELLITIAILGILIAIGIIVLLGLLERWRVDAAANQLAADMRLAHTNATNQLTDWRLIFKPGSPNYSLAKLQAPYRTGAAGAPEIAETIERSLPEGTKVLSSTTTSGAGSDQPFVEFNSDGTSYAVRGPNGHIKVSSTDEDPQRKLVFKSVTSRIRID